MRAEKHGPEIVNLDTGLTPEREFVNYSPEDVENSIAIDLATLERLRPLRSLFQGDAGKLWDSMEIKARKQPNDYNDSEKRKIILKNLDNFVVMVEELEKLLKEEGQHLAQEEEPDPTLS